MRNLQLAILISFYLPIVSSVSVFAQSIDFKGYFFVQSYRNQKGIVIDSVKDIFLKTAKGTFFVKDCNSILPLSNELHLKKVILRGKFEKGYLDFCVVNEIQQSRYGEHIILEDFVLESNFSYSISDGSGNSYTLKGPVLKYVPVTKEMSSSGMYSGGTQKEIELSENERIMLIRSFRRVLKKTRPVSCENNRPMGSIAFQFSQLGEDKNYCCPDSKKWKRFIDRNRILLNQ
jgi:hypothetical protein